MLKTTQTITIIITIIIIIIIIIKKKGLYIIYNKCSVTYNTVIDYTLRAVNYVNISETTMVKLQM